MHVSFALFADAANLSQEGKLNVLGVFDALQVATLPAGHPRAHLVAHLTGNSLDVGSPTRARPWVEPSGTEPWSSPGQLNAGARPRGIIEMALPLIAQIDLPMAAAGGYVMSVSIDGDQASEIPVQVRTSQQSTA